MDPLTLALLVGAGWLVTRSRSQPGVPAVTAGMDPTGAGGVSLGSIAFAQRGPNSDPREWFEGKKPGTVEIGGSPADRGWQPGQTLYKSATLASTAVGLTASIGATGIFGTSGLAVAIGGALPFIGIGLVAVTTILGAIAAHHKAALAREGQLLNSTDPAAMQAFILVAQAAMFLEINSVAEAKQHTDTIIADWYRQVRSIQRGMWPYTLTPQQDPTILTNQPDGGAPDWGNARALGVRGRPDPCNGACVVGHSFIERGAAVVPGHIQN